MRVRIDYDLSPLTEDGSLVTDIRIRQYWGQDITSPLSYYGTRYVPEELTNKYTSSSSIDTLYDSSVRIFVHEMIL